MKKGIAVAVLASMMLFIATCSSAVFFKEKMYRFKNSIAPIYEGQVEKLKILNKNGEDITESFVTETGELFKQKNILKIYSQYSSTVKSIQYSIETVHSNRRTGDISKTSKEIFMGYAYGIEKLGDKQSSAGWDTIAEYTYYLTGSIVYNPNTYKISYASTPIVSGAIYNAGSSGFTMMFSNTPAGDISLDKYSAAFSHSFNLQYQMGGITHYYDRINSSFTIYSD